MPTTPTYTAKKYQSPHTSIWALGQTGRTTYYYNITTHIFKSLSNMPFSIPLRHPAALSPASNQSPWKDERVLLRPGWLKGVAQRGCNQHHQQRVVSRVGRWQPQRNDLKGIRQSDNVSGTNNCVFSLSSRRATYILLTLQNANIDPRAVSPSAGALPEVSHWVSWRDRLIQLAKVAQGHAQWCKRCGQH